MSFHNPIQQFLEYNSLSNHRLFLKHTFNFPKQPKNLRGLMPAAVLQEMMSQPLIRIFPLWCVLQLKRPPEATVHQASTARPGKRANASFTPQGAPCLVEADRGRRLSSPLTAVTDGCHNTRHRVNDGHQTGLIWVAWKDEGSWRREESVGV